MAIDILLIPLQRGIFMNCQRF